MKKYFLLISLFFIAFSSCRKNTITPFNPAVQAVLDDQAIQAYLKANPSVTVTKDASGLYYQILAPGTGAHPTLTSNITVNYTVTGLDGTVYETNPSIYLYLSDLVPAWKTGLPLIGTGGTILMIAPSALVYGNTGSGSIPASTVVIFKVTLQGFN